MSTVTTAIEVTDYQVQVLTETLDKFDFFDKGEYGTAEREHFASLLSNPDSYFGSVLEYCNRPKGIRVLVALNATHNAIRHAFLSLDDSWAPFTEAQVDEANTHLARAL